MIFSLKDKIYGVVFIVLLALFGWYTLHERGIGEAKVKAADERAAAAQVVHNKEVEDRANQKTAAALAAYKATLAAPPAADAPHIVCHVATPRTVPDHGSAGSGDHAAPSVPRKRAADTFDPGPALDKLHTDADAQVKVLQDYIRSCQDAGICKK